MRVKVDGYAWLPKADLGEMKIAELRRSLTFTPRRTHIKQDAPQPVALYRETESHFGMPRSHFLERRKLDYQIDLDVSMGHEVNLSFNGDLRPDQAVAVDAIERSRMTGGMGGLIKAAPGWGKTVMSLAAYTRIGRSALVIVNRGFLQDQWIKRIRGYRHIKGHWVQGFVPDARVGIVRGNKCQFGEEYDISIATIQTLAAQRDKLPPEFWTSFGLIITDEVHRIGAPKWNDIVPKFSAAYRLGVSATPRRKDGMEPVFFSHIGMVLHESKVKRVTPKLRRIYTSFQIHPTSKFIPNRAGDEVLKRWLVKSPERNQLIVDELVMACRAGRKIIVLSERRKHLEILKEMFDKAKPDGSETSFYLGGMKRAELDSAESADVIFSTYQMTAEAFDVPELDTAFFVSPVSDPEQAAGRIMREYGEKKSPVITDFIDDAIPRFSSMWNKRRDFYIKEGMYTPGG